MPGIVAKAFFPRQASGFPEGLDNRLHRAGGFPKSRGQHIGALVAQQPLQLAFFDERAGVALGQIHSDAFPTVFTVDDLGFRAKAHGTWD